jgi:hypothetical protein
VTIPAGQASAQATVTALVDVPDDLDETVTLTIAPGGSPPYAIGTPNEATVTIANTPAPIVTVVATDASATEGGDTGTFTFSRTGPTTNPLTVSFNRSGTATIGGDYNLSPSATTVTIPAGQASAQATVTALVDVPDDLDETVTVTIAPGGSPPYAIGTPDTATVTIVNTPAPVVTVLATDTTATEGTADTGTFTFTRTGPTTNPLTVSFNRSGTATIGGDYNLSPSATTVTIPAGQASAQTTVTALVDVPDDLDETVTLTIAPGGSPPYAIGTPDTATVTITNTPAPVVTVVATDGSASEGGDTGTFTFTRTGPTTDPLTINFNRSGTATIGGDYNLSPSSTTVTIPAGQTSAQTTVTALVDVPDDLDETVTVTIFAGGSPPYAIGTPNEATVTIVNTPAPIVTVVATDASATEGGDTATFTFTRTGPTTDPLTINFTRSGTATIGGDYNLSPSSTTVTIPAGQASAETTVTALVDATEDLDETVTVTIFAGGSPPYAIGTPSEATITIIDNSGANMEWVLAAIDSTPHAQVRSGNFAQR